MRQLVYYIGQSIDGFIAGPGDEVDFFPVPDEYATWMFTQFGDALPTHARKLGRVDGFVTQIIKRPAAGRYRLALTATDAAGNKATARTSLTVR